MEKILVTGANGLLGQHLINRLLNEGFAVVGTGRGQSRLPFEGHQAFAYHAIDLSDSAAIDALLAAERPAAVVHGGAMTQIDECENNTDSCFEVNVQATANLTVAAEQYAGFFLFVSTDFVFDGELGNYREEDPLKPVSWYGFTKVQAESTVETCEIPWSIVRTCLVYGNSLIGKRSNIITWVKSSLEAQQPIKVVSDQVRTPTYIEDLVAGILLILRKRATGIFHIAGKDRLTPYDMALATARYFSLDAGLIERVDASTFTQPARRPLITGLDITKAKRELGYDPISFEEGLQRMKL